MEKQEIESWAFPTSMRKERSTTELFPRILEFDSHRVTFIMHSKFRENRAKKTRGRYRSRARSKTSKEIKQLAQKAIQKAEEDEELALTDNQHELLCYTATQILTDGSSWDDDECRSWMGFTPSTDHIFEHRDNIAQAKLIKRLHDGWHYAAVRMVGYIWGARQQELEKKKSSRRNLRKR